MTTIFKRVLLSLACLALAFSAPACSKKNGNGKSKHTKVEKKYTKKTKYAKPEKTKKMKKEKKVTKTKYDNGKKKMKKEVTTMGDGSADQYKYQETVSYE